MWTPHIQGPLTMTRVHDMFTKKRFKLERGETGLYQLANVKSTQGFAHVWTLYNPHAKHTSNQDTFADNGFVK